MVMMVVPMAMTVILLVGDGSADGGGSANGDDSCSACW